MLARRFTIVCLITTLFGMFFAILAAETAGPTPTNAGPVACLIDGSFSCPRR